eukprot:766612-Hanusia_phi.AAC.4
MTAGRYMKAVLLLFLLANLSGVIGDARWDKIETSKNTSWGECNIARDVWAGEAMDSIITRPLDGMQAGGNHHPEHSKRAHARSFFKGDILQHSMLMIRRALRYRIEGCHVSKPGCLDFLVELLDTLPDADHVAFPSQADGVLRWKCGAGKCQSCAVVGNAWHLLGSSLGDEIDKNDVVIRFGGAIEHGGFEQDVGRRSDLRVVYHSTAPRRRVSEGERVLHLVTRIPDDLRSFLRLHRSFSGGDDVTSDEDLRVFLLSPWLIEAARKQLGWENSFSPGEGDNNNAGP